MCLITFSRLYADPIQDYKKELFIDIKKEREANTESLKKKLISLISLQI